ncbi:hypothetical protein D7Y05_15200 [bacterium 1XD42-54]|nr:hypothetical protein D7Y05_15200 [bacterium 1XD42-54]
MERYADRFWSFKRGCGSQAIYQALGDKYLSDPEECMFFDDRAENIEGARAFGMKTIQILSMEGFLNDLRKLLS